MTSERAAEGAHVLQQPVAGVGVEVVGRLVEQQQLAAGEQDAGELEAATLATGQRADVQVQAVAASGRGRPRCVRASDSAA